MGRNYYRRTCRQKYKLTDIENYEDDSTADELNFDDNDTPIIENKNQAEYFILQYKKTIQSIEENESAFKEYVDWQTKKAEQWLESVNKEHKFIVKLAYKYGLKNVLPPLGTSFTEEHANFLKAGYKIQIFCKDGDDAGRKSIQKGVEKMFSLGIYSKVLLLPERTDLADIANKYKYDLTNYFEKHMMHYWQYILKEVTEECENKLQ